MITLGLIWIVHGVDTVSALCFGLEAHTADVFHSDYGVCLPRLTSIQLESSERESNSDSDEADVAATGSSY